MIHHLKRIGARYNQTHLWSNLRSSIESEPALVLGPLRSNEEQWHEQQLLEIAARKKEREDQGGEGTGPPVLEKPDELEAPFNYDFSYWARWECYY